MSMATIHPHKYKECIAIKMASNGWKLMKRIRLNWFCTSGFLTGNDYTDDRGGSPRSLMYRDNCEKWRSRNPVEWFVPCTYSTCRSNLNPMMQLAFLILTFDRQQCQCALFMLVLPPKCGTWDHKSHWPYSFETMPNTTHNHRTNNLVSSSQWH